MLHTLLFSQSVPSSGCAPDKLSPNSEASGARQLRRTLSSSNTPTASPPIERLQSEANPTFVIDMPANSKNPRKKKAGKPAEAAATVESPTKPTTKPTTNNYAGKPNGKAGPTPSSHPSSGGRPILSLISRLLAWYTLYTVLFQCPTNPNSSSPTVCHLYNKVQQSLIPHLQPYYTTYASPYVDKVTPYISQYNEAYLYPAFEVASSGYEKYAQPSIQKARKEYQKKLYPHISQVSTQLNGLYGEHLAPHTNKLYNACQDAAASPYWTAVKDHLYKVYFLPTYKQVSPYLNRAYENGRYAAVVVLGPYVKKGARVGGEWLEKNVWSGISDIWKDYVEVQVDRIKERVNGGNDNASSVPSSHSDSEGDPSTLEESPERKSAREAARKQIEEDLAFYQDKFDKHANEAIESLNAKVDQIATVAMEERRPNIEERMRKLDKMIENEMRTLKATIMNLAKYYKPGSSEEETKKNKLKSFDKLFEATSKVGKLTKDTVQEMRWDAQKFLATIFDEVAAEADTHIEKIDSIIDSGIQELGMKWAWEQEGVTHKDWARYQDLKKEFSGSKTKVVQAAEKNKKLTEITNWAEGDAWEGGAYARAKEVTDELGRLKRIAKKKIELNDYSDDFSDKYLSIDQNEAATPSKRSSGSLFAAAHAIAGDQHVVVEDEDALRDSLTEKVKESVDDIKEGVKNAADHASKAVSEAIYGTKTTQPVGESITSVAGDLYSSAWSAASSALYGTPEPGYMGIATDKYSAAVEAASKVIYGTPTPVSLYEQAYSKYQEAVKQAGDKYQQVLHDANVAINGEPQPAHESIISAAGEKYNFALKAAQEKYTSVLDSASTAIYGTPQPAHESLLSAANEKYSAAVFAAQDNYSKLISRASTAVIGTPTPATEIIASAISEKVHEIADKASSAEKIASGKIYGTPQPLSESIVSRAGEAVDSAKVYAGEQVEAVGQAVESAASVVLENAEAASSKVVSMMTPPPAVENILNSANDKFQEIVDIASERIYGREKGTMEKATSAVGEAYDAASSRVSVAVYGKETGAFESALNMISDAAKSASAEISIAVYGTPKTPFEKATSVIAENVDAATKVVAENVEAATSIIGENLQAAKSAAAEALYGREEEKYYSSLVESAAVKLQNAAESASAKLSLLYEESKKAGGKKVDEMKVAAAEVSEAVSEAASSVVEKVKETYEQVKDEL